jgi:hypothetical protein
MVERGKFENISDSVIASVEGVNDSARAHRELASFYIHQRVHSLLRPWSKPRLTAWERNVGSKSSPKYSQALVRLSDSGNPGKSLRLKKLWIYPGGAHSILDIWDLC